MPMRNISKWESLYLPIFIFTAISAFAQPEGFNYDESKVPDYALPDPLILPDGQPITSPEVWFTIQRPRILRLFEEQVYGKAPGRPEDLNFKLNSTDKAALDGKAIRKEISIYLKKDQSSPIMDLLVYLGRRYPFS